MVLEEDLLVYVDGHLYRLFATCVSIRSDFFAAAINFSQPTYPNPLKVELSDERIEEFEFILPFLDLRYLSPLESCVKDHTLVPQLTLGDKFQIPLVMHTCEHVMLQALTTSSSPVSLNELIIAQRFNLKRIWQASTKSFLMDTPEFPERTLISLLEEVQVALDPERDGSPYGMLGNDVFNDVVRILWLAALSALMHWRDELKCGIADHNMADFLKSAWKECRICYEDFNTTLSSSLCHHQTICCFLPLVLKSLCSYKTQGVAMYPGMPTDYCSSKRDYIKAYQQWLVQTYPDQLQETHAVSPTISAVEMIQAATSRTW